MKLKSIILTLFLFLSANGTFAQQVTNIHFEQVGKQIHIYYDLQGDQSYTVQVFCSTDNGQSWGEPLQQVSGSVGENQKPGNGKMIVWDVLTEREKLTGEISFKIEATGGANIEMVFVKGGSFQMGSRDGGSDERPVHTVTVNDFYIGRYEVTQKQWREVMGNNPSYNSGCDNCPVERVSWNDIQKFLKKLNEKTGMNFRLPTEAEWEFAARGGNQSNGHTYSGSNTVGDVAWYNGNSGSQHQVGTKGPNELGIYDMSGNVWEWCHDWYDASYYSISLQNNPKGPASGTFRVLRGGSWFDNSLICRVANRFRYNPDSSSNYIGFRIVR